MALKVDYVVKETGTNLVRNITLTIATVVTIAFTLAFVGGAFLARTGVENAQGKFKGNVQFIVFMNPDATQAQIDAVGRSLTESPQVKNTKYLNHDAAYAEFKTLFADRPQLAESLTPAETPTSYKVFLKDGSTDLVLSLVDEYRKMAGVKEVSAATKTLRDQEDGFAAITTGLFIGALVVGLTSLVLIVNSIRVAMFARRREIEVMKLVGATNWFIRVPYMVEGMVQGLVGSVVGIGFVWAIRAWLLPYLVKAGGIFLNFKISGEDFARSAVYMLVIGMVVGIGASAVAATRYLDV